MMAGSFRVDCKDAHGSRAGAIIAALGGLCAEGRRSQMATPLDTLDPEVLDQLSGGLRSLSAGLREIEDALTIVVEERPKLQIVTDEGSDDG